MISRFLFSLLVLTGTSVFPCAAQTPSSNAPAASAQKAESLLEARSALVVKGTGEAQVAPGHLWLTLNILGDGETDDRAIVEARQNADKATALLQKIHPAGGKPVWTKPIWHNLPTQESQEKGKTFRATTSSAAIHFADTALVQKFVEALREAKLSGSVGIQGDLGENRDAGYNQALRQAVQRAKERAAILSEASQLTKVELLGLRESDATMPVIYDTLFLQDQTPLTIPQRLTVRATVTLYWGVAEGGKRPTITASSRTAAKPTPKTSSPGP